MIADWLIGRIDYLGFLVVTAGILIAIDRALRRRKGGAAPLPRAVWVLASLLLVAGFFLVEAAGRRSQQRVVTAIEALAPTYAAELERMGHSELDLASAEHDPRYLQMIEAVRRWERLNPLVSDIYTYRRDADGRVVFLVDAESDYDRNNRFEGERERRTRPGEPYPAADETIFRAFEGEATFNPQPVSDRWGNWVSAQVPMRDASGRVEAVLGVDYPGEVWRAEILGRRRVVLLYLGLVVLALAAGGLAVGLERSELRVRAEDAAKLRMTEARLRALLDHLPFSLWLLDAGGRCRACNSLATATRGAKEGRDLESFGFDATERAAIEEDRRRAAAGVVVTRESTCLREGAVRHVFRLFAPVEEGPGRVGLVAMEWDVTDRVRAEQERRSSEQRVALHVQQMPVAYIELSADLRVLRWNPAAEKIFGYGAEEVAGRNFEALIVPESARGQVRAVCRRLLAGESVERQTNENRTKDGRIITCEWTSTPLVDADGKVIAVASHASDVTGRIALEERLRRTERLELIGQLAGGVAHEFNNLLAPMLMSVGQIAEERADDARLLALLRPVRESIRLAAQLNQRILTVGRRGGERPEPSDLNLLVEEAADLLRQTLDRRIELRLSLAPNLPPALVPRGAISQIVMNLALNARDALVERIERGDELPPPRLFLATELLPAPAGGPEGPRPSRSCLALSVRDNGPGMDEEVRRRVFEPFFTTKPAGKGTGLGLPVVLSLVEGLGGSIQVRSRPGEGACFTVCIPAGQPGEARTEPAPAANLADPTRAEGRSLRVLLVEDNPLVSDTFRRVIERAGHRVTCADDGEAGLRILNASPGHPYDLMLADLNMPRLSGRALVERVQGRGLVDVIFVVSGLVDQGTEADLSELGVERVMRKPVELAELLGAVSDVARRTQLAKAARRG
jgi:PAS domain S-box-containing protein